MKKTFTKKSIEVACRLQSQLLLVLLMLLWSSTLLFAQTLSEQALYLTNQFQKTRATAQQKGWPLHISITPQKTISLQGIDALGQPVYYITHNSPLAIGTHTDALYAGGALGLSLSGESSSVRNKLALWDGGRVRADHRELSGKLVQTDVTSGSFNDHATHLAGILVARGVQQQAKGMSFGADLKVWDLDNDLSEVIQAAPGLLVSNHAYGPVAGWLLNTRRPGSSNDEKWEWWGTPTINDTQDYRFGFYDETVSEIDRITFNNPYYLMVRSADNKRVENGPPAGVKYYLKNTSIQSTVPRSRNDSYDIIPGAANAKNVLTVGSAEPSGSVFKVAPYSGWGPTDDGRIKPDLLGIGTRVMSSVGTDTDAYGTLSGTSMASANVSGSLLLLQELYQKKEGSYMQSATLKGLAIHTADPPDGQTAPDYTYGWGLLNSEKAAQVILNQNGSYQLAEKVLRQGTPYTQKIIASGTGPLKVTICWTDPEGYPTEVSSRNVNNTSPKLVNDLDIRVQEGFNTYYPWVLDPAVPAQQARTGDNIRDNVEQIYLANTLKGRSYTITISHKRTLKNGQQPFALIISGIEKANCDQAVQLSPASDTTLCPGQTLTLAANAGNNLTYEWFQNGTSLKKGTERFLEVSRAGSYAVRVTAPGCEALSKTLVVKNSTLYAAIDQKGRLQVCESKGITLSANTGTGYLYQWLLNGQAIKGATQPQHQATQSGIYQVQISHQGCSLVSVGTEVEVTPVLVSLSPAGSASICNGAPAILSTPQQQNFSYRWYYNNLLLSGASTATLQASSPGRYAVEVSHGACQVRSPDVVVQRINLTASIAPPPTTRIPAGGSLPLQANYAIGNQYAWYRNNTLLPQETAPLLKVAQGGVYKVVIENATCQAESAPVTLWDFKTDSVLATEPPLDSLQLLLYPNPAHEKLMVALRPEGAASDLHAEILTLPGQTLISQAMVPERNIFKSEFDLSKLSPGVYLIKIKAGLRTHILRFLKY